MQPRRRRLAVLTPLVLLALADLSAARGDGWEAVVEVLRHREGDERTAEQLTDELAGLPDEAIGPLFELHAGSGLERLLAASPEDDVAGAWWRSAPDRLGGLALDALGRRDPRPVVEWLEERLEGGASLEERLGALSVLAALGSARGMEPALAIGGSFEGPELEYLRVQRALRDALGSMLSRDAYAVDELTDQLHGLPPRLLDLVVDALGSSGRAGATRLLLDILGTSARLDLSVVHAVTEIHAERPWRARPDEDPRPALRRMADDPDWTLRRAALLALARLHDAGSFRLFVAALEDAHPRVQRAAAWALARLSENVAPRTPERWMAWRDRRVAAFEEVLGEAGPLADLSTPDALAAIRGLAGRSLLRHEAAREVARACDHPDPVVVRAACEALARLGSKQVVPDLVDLLAADPAARSSAWRALLSLTGHDLPPDPEAWASL